MEWSKVDTRDGRGKGVKLTRGMEEIRKRRRKVDTRDGREKEEKGVKLTRGKERSSHTYCSVSSTVPWRLLFRVAYFSVAVVNPQPTIETNTITQLWGFLPYPSLTEPSSIE